MKTGNAVPFCQFPSSDPLLSTSSPHCNNSVIPVHPEIKENSLAKPAADTVSYFYPHSSQLYCCHGQPLPTGAAGLGPWQVWLHVTLQLCVWASERGTHRMCSVISPSQNSLICQSQIKAGQLSPERKIIAEFLVKQAFHRHSSLALLYKLG